MGRIYRWFVSGGTIKIEIYEYDHFVSVKGSLHKMIFTKYTELLLLKNIFRIFWNYFWNILETNVFQSKHVKNVLKTGGHR